MTLWDVKLNLSEHTDEKIKNKGIKKLNVIKILDVTLPRSSQLKIYRSFIRPHMDYGSPIKMDYQKKLNLFNITQH